MSPNQILGLFAVSFTLFSLNFVGHRAFASEVFDPGLMQDQKGVETIATNQTQDGLVKKLALPLRLSAIVSTTATAVIWSKYSQTHNDYMEAKEIDEISKRYDESNRYYKLRNGLIVATGLLWGANLIALWLNPPPENLDEFESIPKIGHMGEVSLSGWNLRRAGGGLALNWSEKF